MTACFRVDAAMIVHIRVMFAFVRADLAGNHAGVKLGVHEFIWRFRLSDEQACRGGTHVRTIKIRDNAAAQLFEMFQLTEACVGARRARFGARGQGGECIRIVPGALLVGAGVTAQHQFDRFHSCSVPPAAVLCHRARPVCSVGAERMPVVDRDQCFADNA